MNAETLTCVVCDVSHERGSDSIGQWHDEGHTPYPVCRMCHENGRHDSWRRVAIEEIKASNVAFISSDVPNLAAHIKELRAYQKHDSRINDGVCPNGCALMLPDPEDDRDQRCPSCGFTQHRRTLSMPS